MDNFIQWLVILFFIISFLNSILKPKKTSQKGTPPRSRDRVITSGPTVDIPDLQSDIEEAIRRKRTEAEKRKSELKTQFQKKYSEQKVFDSKEAETRKRTRVKEPESVTQKNPVVTAEQKRTESFTKVLLNPESARKAILLAEILGKPKALKRKW